MLGRNRYEICILIDFHEKTNVLSFDVNEILFLGNVVKHQFHCCIHFDYVCGLDFVVHERGH